MMAPSVDSDPWIGGLLEEHMAQACPIYIVEQGRSVHGKQKAILYTAHGTQLEANEGCGGPV